ncbi:type IX secretion system periplasmic lipoprotein PorW/SprE [Catalinimonas niigatensis]|uniref:type IX secretion system periplasmic lipoprotein PorW/SprE n=1 Tax=Catalinimonas niigatensis TaxID=1397264 RepID=UPI0026652D84|nr:tetratricopeptide repeat protein [Catalinimonas niigatensis]WPP52840.1 methyltransferase [Catalinimonas niigatensis]
MKVKVFSKYYILYYTLLLWCFSACAPERNGMVASVYHNTTARYNAYFYAQMRMDEIQAAIQESQENNFNDILRIYPEVDTSLINTMKDKVEDCMKKASIAIERHPKSRWADDSYILIGQCRMYNQNYEDAIKTFKFVNTESEDDDARHSALIHLMRTFIDALEQNNAIAVSDFLKKEKLNDKNKAKLYLTRAYLAQLNEDYSNMVGNLLLAAPLLHNEEGRARTYFIIGQIYQDLGFDAQAYQNYEEVLKSNPEYELYFYARLNMAQVYDLSKENDTRKIRKYFRKLLKDKKNLEYKDKIYYEMAAFEQKQGNLDEAMEYYNESIQASLNNNRQKAYAYLALGKIYYSDKKDYQLAKVYYDSTMSVLPQDEEEYPQIAERQQVLDNFVQQLGIIQEQDSLLALAKIDSLELSAYLDQVILEEDQRAAEQERENLRRSRNVRNNSFEQVQSPFMQQEGGAQAGSGENWYFYTPSALSIGRTAYIRRWGNRELEDNWRRSEKTIEGNFASNDVEAIDAAASIPTQGAVVENTADNRKQQLYANIPFTEEAQQQALLSIEEAYYKLGGIYNFDLEEKHNAIETFETMLARFPQSEHKPEVLYELYLLYKALDDDTYVKYKNQLLQDHPESIYAKILENPNYREESNLASEKLKQLYKSAYKLYGEGEYEEAEKIITASLKEYTANDFTDNMKFLRILIIGKTEDFYQYQLGLQNFLKEYPESELYAYGEKLLEKSRTFKEEEAKRRGANYRERFDRPHSFIILYNNVQKISTDLPKAINEFNSQKFDENILTVANLMLEGGKVMIIVEKFADKEGAMNYYRQFTGEETPLKQLSVGQRNEVADSFVITEDNLNILLQTQEVDKYLRFFEKHYMEF